MSRVDPLRVGAVVGWTSDADLAERLHDLEHRGVVETVVLSADDARRHRLRATTDRGTTVEIALDRDTSLGDGAVLEIDQDRAIVVRLVEPRWLRVRPVDLGAALAVGHLAGHLHWRVRFEPGVVLVAVEGPEADYRARLAELVERGHVRVEG